MVPSAQQPSGAANQHLPVLPGGSSQAPLTPELLEKLSAILPGYVASRRWFRSKARQIRAVTVQDLVPFGGQHLSVLLLAIEYTDGAGDTYVLPVTVATGEAAANLTDAAEPIATLQLSNGQTGVLHSALTDPEFRSQLFQAIAKGASLSGSNGAFVAVKTPVPSYADANLEQTPESFVSRAEQSNTSIIFGDQFILKLFRKVEAGINPDIEVGRFLTEHRFANTPAVLGTLEYRSGEGQVFSSGILQPFIRNQGDAWKYTLEELSGYFQRALAQGGPMSTPTVHPLELMEQEVPADVAQLIGRYLQSASLLGRRTAEMHQSLGSDRSDPEFAPEPFTNADGQKLYREMHAQADTAFSVLRSKAGQLQGSAAEHAQELLAAEEQIRSRFAQLQNSRITAERIRFHGDYHLGQVLFTGSDFMIIDFEGEPARPLSERREKTIGLRDVAGMVRSFQYAGYASLFGQVPGLPEGNRNMIEAYAGLWYAWVSATYLRGYFATARNASFVPETQSESRLLLDAFLLHKALYEVAYELNNRPDWVVIPLRGILSLLS